MAYRSKEQMVMKIGHITIIYLKKIAPCILLLVFLSGCGGEKETVFNGTTMGTTYQVKIITGYFSGTSGLKEKIDNQLQAINQSMSTYIVDSEISRFNHIKDTQERLAISDDFLQVMLAARDIYEKTDGAWDGTLKPLVNLWGFGNTRQAYQVPDKTDINKQMRWVGFQHIEIDPQGYLRKKQSAITLDLASIAKGYAVDQVSGLLQELGLANFLVEVGGEVFASGVRKDGTPWRVGINQPSTTASTADIYQVVPLKNSAMATSGDYRNYFEAHGQRYSHILDPRTGYPVNNGVVSVSIVTKSCMLADGLATAIMVMGLEKGMTLLHSLKGVEGFIILRNEDNGYTHHATGAFSTLSQ
jgi:FAD:protein FMN transferase